MRELTFLLILCLLWVAPAVAQSPTATINGIVLDPTGAAIAGAQVVVVNDATGVQYTTKTNGEGIYVVPNLPPGPYRIQVSNSGFKTIIKPDIFIHVQDALAINFTLPIGAASEVVTVKGGTPLINTENAAVSTVVDRKFVGNMPLNGRSFQDLILLTPGTVTGTPQNGATEVGAHGEFSVNGQRSESNYYTVDGVSANVGVVSGDPTAPTTSGSLPTATALGTTQSLVSVDALEEFRVQSSTYSAEYGRNPGGQFSFVTRSGTNDWHGTAFEYLRNNFFDANDWFNDYLDQPEPALRQNDFGGTLGGPVQIPRVYSGKDRTFFFFSYEGLRLIQPENAFVYHVPDATLRQNTPSPLKAVMNAFPLPNGREVLDSAGNPTGLAEFTRTWSNPSSIDSYSVRLDHTLDHRTKLFFRFSSTPSYSLNRIEANTTTSNFTTRTYTAGATSLFSSRFGNEFRFNYTSNASAIVGKSDSFGGATPVDLIRLQGLDAPGLSPLTSVRLFFDSTFPNISQQNVSSEQRQWNLVDAVSVSVGRHQFRFGSDYRRLAPRIPLLDPETLYLFFSESSVLANSVDLGQTISQSVARPVYTNFSAFAQDEWRVTPRLSLSMGVRWDVNPAPSAARDNIPYTVEGKSLATLALAPRGTPLWKTDWYGLAPRVGAAYILRNAPGYETVVRGGAGVFFDTGQQAGSFGYAGPGLSATTQFGSGFGVPASFPLPAAQLTPPIVNPPVPPYNSTVYAFPAHLQLPYTLQWNVSIEQALGKSQALTVSYVGANARKLLEQNQVQLSGPPLLTAINPNFTSVSFFQNGLTSDYNALQITFQRRLSRGLQALGSYTWAHAIDYGSFNLAQPYARGDSDFDVRHNLSTAISYDLPNVFENGFAHVLLHNWGIDDRFTARTAFPVTLNGGTVVDPGTAQVFFGGLDQVAGVPIYIYGSQCAAVYANGMGCPGGRAINPNAFALPPVDPNTGNQIRPGNAPRNFVRGFGAWQMDMSVRRDFPIYERLKLQFRAEAFNVFNHPNFGSISANYCAPGPFCTFGQASQTLGQSLGILRSLYQAGGPRSLQFSLRLAF